MIKHWVVVLTLASFLFASSLGLANPLLPGLFESLEKIITLDSDESKDWKNTTAKNESLLIQKSRSGTTFFLAPEFLQSLLLNATSQQLILLAENPCALSDMLWLNQLRHGNGKFESVPLLYSPGKASYSTLWVSRESFAKYLMSTKCKKSEEMAYLFSAKNLPNVLSQVQTPQPKDEAACIDLLSENQKNPKTPYYCYLVDAAQKGEISLKLLQENSNNVKDLDSKKKLVLQSLKVKEMLGPEKFDYLQNLCGNINTKELFCSYFFSNDYWKKKIINVSNSILLTPTCPDKDAKSCAEHINRTPTYCHWSMLNNPSLLPRANCQESSTALNFSSLNFNYRDCPARLANTAITNAGRILFHFGYDKILFAKSKKPQPPDIAWSPTTLCNTTSATALLDFTHKVEWDDVWNSKICFTDRLQRKHFCSPYLISNLPNSAFSLTSTVTEILKKANRMDRGYQCSLIDEKQYDNRLLKFKTGCWILTPENFEMTSTNVRVVIDDREQRDVFKISDKVTFPYLSNSTQTEYNNFQSKIEKELSIKASLIKTLSAAELHLKKPQAILHGIGCLEELLPDYFISNNLSQCSAAPFIISGILKSEKVADAYMVVHSSLDEVASPRIISWHQIVFSVEAYQRIHPRMAWSLYGLTR